MKQEPSPADSFSLFVRAKEGRIVSRFGSRTAIGYQFMPGTGPDKPSEHRWDTETIHAIPAAEAIRYWIEYQRELGPDGGLVAATREEWLAQHAKKLAAKKKAVEEQLDALVKQIETKDGEA